MKILLVSCVQEVSYQWRQTTLLTTSRRDKAVPTVPGVAFSYLDEEWSQLWLVVKPHRCACEHHFERGIRMRNNLLAGWYNAENFRSMQAGRCGLYPLLLPGGLKTNALIFYSF